MRRSLAGLLLTAIALVGVPGHAQLPVIQIETVMNYRGVVSFTVVHGFDQWTYDGTLTFRTEIYSCQCDTSGHLTLTVSGNRINALWKGSFHITWDRGAVSQGSVTMSGITYGNRQVLSGTFTSGSYAGKRLRGIITVVQPTRESFPFSGIVTAGD